MVIFHLNLLIFQFLLQKKDLTFYNLPTPIKKLCNILQSFFTNLLVIQLITMKKLLSFILVLSFSMIVFAQKTISGVITDGDGKPLASASVTIEEPGKNAILAYGISNAKGEYKVTVASSESNLDLKIKAFNQKPITQSNKNDDQKLNFSMDSQATEIQEVRLKTKLITKKGDTISYDLKSFENKTTKHQPTFLKK